LIITSGRYQHFIDAAGAIILQMGQEGEEDRENEPRGGKKSKPRIAWRGRRPQPKFGVRQLAAAFKRNGRFVDYE
jgi:hypothetical protein